MSDALVLVGGESPGAPMAWALVGANGNVVDSGFTDEGRTPPSSHPARTVLVLPGAEARLRRLDLPARTEAQARAGAPYLFEGALAGGDVHYAVGTAQDENGARLVAAISTQRLRQWLERCRALGADPQLVALDCTIWPCALGVVEVVVTRERVIVAGGGFGGYSIEPGFAPHLFARWAGDAQANPNRIVIRGGDLEAWRAAAGPFATRVEAGPELDVLATLAAGALQAANTMPNLRQGSFAPAGRRDKPLKAWRFAALLAAAALLLQVGSQFISGLRDYQAARLILSSAERDFQQLYPDARIVNLRTQVAARINQVEQSARHPLLTAATPLADVLRSQPLARIDDVRHSAPGRNVSVQISSTDQAALESSLGALRGAGLTVESNQLPPRAGRFVLELSFEAPP